MAPVGGDGGDHSGDRGHHHGHHHGKSRDYSWEEGMAEFFLEQARHDAERRYPPVARLVADLVDGTEHPVVLDLGCGPALLSSELPRAVPGARYVGVDPSRPMLELAQKVLEEEGTGEHRLLEGIAEDIPLEDASVDVVVALKNLHEWDDADRGMREVARVLRPGGHLFLRDSNGSYPYWRLRLYVGWVRLTRGRMVTHSYLGPYPDAYGPEQVEAFIEGAGLEIVEAKRRSVELEYLARRPRR